MVKKIKVVELKTEAAPAQAELPTIGEEAPPEEQEQDQQPEQVQEPIVIPEHVLAEVVACTPVLKKLSLLSEAVLSEDIKVRPDLSKSTRYLNFRTATNKH